MKDAADLSRDHRATERHRIQHDRANPLLERRQDEDVHRGESVVEIEDVRDEGHMLVDPQLARESPKIGLFGTGSGDHELDLASGRKHACGGIQKERETLHRLERPGRSHDGDAVVLEHFDQLLRGHLIDAALDDRDEIT